MNEHLVSVIIPCFNQARYLDEALKSVFEQTYKNWECIIVNDGSEDDTETIANKWVNKDNRFNYIYKKNGGLSNARNVGLQNAIGDYVQFLDSDDYISINKLEIQIKDLITHDISVCDYFSFTDGTKDKAPHKYLTPFFSQLNYKKEIIWDWEYRKSFPPHCVLFKRKLIPENNMKFNENLSNHEDWEFWVKLFYSSESLFNNSEVLAFYRIRNGSMSTDFVPMLKGFLQAAKILQDFFKAENNEELHKLSKEKYKEVYHKNRVPFLKKIKNKVYSKLAFCYRYVRKN
ncbi:glycosyltransferase family 2 protein [uncultured Algibacter sp.]|uniref:glycosyltransferase family 2 protein n=1 Tax=uncultured Algibacter sp. TaxID=298659 RepID=UPI002634EDA4|nr:glycosyltransferase family 2 protein [uncultured Algibacter sp.]